jgi:hypothetical protein
MFAISLEVTRILFCPLTMLCAPPLSIVWIPYEKGFVGCRFPFLLADRLGACPLVPCHPGIQVKPLLTKYTSLPKDHLDHPHHFYRFGSNP